MLWTKMTFHEPKIIFVVIADEIVRSRVVANVKKIAAVAELGSKFRSRVAVFRVK